MTDNRVRTRTPAGNMSLTRSQAYYNKGLDAFARKDFVSARLAFEKAIGLCACKKSVRDAAKTLGVELGSLPSPKCVCKTFYTQPTIMGEVDFYAIAKRPCRCGSDIRQCGSAIHVKALDGAAAASENLGDYKAAHEFSLLLITIASEKPEGYLRLGKVMRLLPKPASPEECRFVYKQGHRIVSKYGDQKDPKLATLAKLATKFNKADMVEKLPTELCARILGQLSMRDLCRTMRVSKGWHHQALNESLWVNLDFTRSKALSSLRLVNILFRRSNFKTQAIRIPDAKRFALNGTKMFMLIYTLPHLRKLALQANGHFRIPEVSLTKPLHSPHQKSELTKLRLDYVFHDSRYLIAILQHVAPSLKEFALRGGPPSIWKDFPWLLNLEALELERTRDETLHPTDESPRYVPTTWMENLASRTPNLRRLCLSGYAFNPQGSALLNEGLESHVWQDLEELVVVLPEGIVSHDKRIFNFQLNESLKVVDISHAGLLERQLDNAAGRLPFENRIQNLECFRLSSTIEADLLKQYLGPSVANHKLRALDLCLMYSVASDYDDPRLKTSDLDFLCKEDIEILGLSNYFYPYIDWRLEDGVRPAGTPSFLDWVATFPNLHTVYAYPFQYEGDEYAIEDLINLGIKTIITDRVLGVGRDRIMRLAYKKGVSIIHVPRSRLPRFWNAER